MNRDIIKGKWLQLKGRVRQTFGSITGDRSEQAKGAAQEVGGKLREGAGKLEDTAEHPRKPSY